MTEDIDCVVNQEYSIGCRKEGDEVYIPFTFIKKYFEVTHFEINFVEVVDSFH